jgi:hypothetical protein
VLLPDVLQRRDRGVVLDQAEARRERDREGHVEGEIALAGLLATTERAVSASMSACCRQVAGVGALVKHTEELADALLATSMARCRQLD